MGCAASSPRSARNASSAALDDEAKKNDKNAQNDSAADTVQDANYAGTGAAYGAPTAGERAHAGKKDA
eukprot:scaffold675074_cov42-Prasinocladus_malaysianus.AAC.1